MNDRSSADASRQRVFVALWPPPEVRARLASSADEIAALAPRCRLVTPANFHLTLAFIGGLAHDGVDRVARQLESEPVSTVDWTLDEIGHFERASVIWAGGKAPPALIALAARVRDLLETLDIAFDRKPFAPHVTLLRHVVRWPTGRTRIDPPIVWTCTRPTLARSERHPGGSAYVRLGGH